MPVSQLQAFIAECRDQPDSGRYQTDGEPASCCLSPCCCFGWRVGILWGHKESGLFACVFWFYQCVMRMLKYLLTQVQFLVFFYLTSWTLQTWNAKRSPLRWVSYIFQFALIISSSSVRQIIQKWWKDLSEINLAWHECIVNEKSHTITVKFIVISSILLHCTYFLYVNTLTGELYGLCQCFCFVYLYFFCVFFCTLDQKNFLLFKKKIILIMFYILF